LYNGQSNTRSLKLLTVMKTLKHAELLGDPVLSF
jgi:hypothetical protein